MGALLSFITAMQIIMHIGNTSVISEYLTLGNNILVNQANNTILTMITSEKIGK